MSSDVAHILLATLVVDIRNCKGDSRNVSHITSRANATLVSCARASRTKVPDYRSIGATIVETPIKALPSPVARSWVASRVPIASTALASSWGKGRPLVPGRERAHLRGEMAGGRANEKGPAVAGPSFE